MNIFCNSSFVKLCPPCEQTREPINLKPDRYKSPMQSSILWLTNSLLFLNPLLFKILLPFTIKALSKLPPFAKPNFLVDLYPHIYKKYGTQTHD